MAKYDRFWRIVFLIIPLTLFVIIVIGPLLYSFYYSFTNWNGFNPNYKFVGFYNFFKVFKDPLFANAIQNTLIWTISAIVIPTLFGLFLALMLDTNIKGSNFYKSIFYLPICLSPIVVGQIWIWIYQPTWGLLNTNLVNLGLEDWTLAWLANPQTSLYAVIIAWSWQQTGLSMVIYLSGLTTIPEDLLEAAEIDGAGKLRKIWNIIIPLLKSSTVVVVALSVINSLKGFDIVYIMTGGGPFHSSDTLAIFMYNESFKKYLMGYGSAISVVLFIITMTIIIFYFRQLKSLDKLYA
jgi:ABC-type sugar transport system permease subunit